MDDPRMELPPPEELGQWLERSRKTHGITQSELADRADVSPSQISRIEGSSSGAAYETLYRIQTALETILTEREALGEQPRRAEDVLQAKHEEYGEAYELVSVEPETPVPEAVDRLAELQVSQLPVLTSTGESVGRITEGDLLDIDGPEDRVRRHMGSPFPEVGADTPAVIVRDLLRSNAAVLVTPGDTDLEPLDHGYVGILTRADFAGDRYSDTNGGGSA